MANHVVVAAVGARQAAVEPQASPARAVAEVIVHLRERIAQVLSDRPDLIVLPEACDLPAGWDFCGPRYLEEFLAARGDRILEDLAGLARERRCHIAYPAARRLPDGTLRNSILLIDRGGALAGTYDKCHPTVWENEAGILCGAQPVVAACDFGRVGMAVCFDLNFDELRLAYAREAPDLILFSSMYHGGLMQAYWAYSCRAHFAAAIAGTAASVISPVGMSLAEGTNYRDHAVARINLDCLQCHLDYNEERLRAMKEKHGPGVKVTVPGYLGSVLVSAETEGLTARGLAKEFSLELLDDYFARARAVQRAHRPSSSA